MVFIILIYKKFKIRHILKKKLWEKGGKNDVKVEVGKMKLKIYFVLYSNACSILELMLCNRNLTKLVDPTLLCLNCSA